MLLAAVLGVLFGWFALPFAVSLPPGLFVKNAGSPVFLDRHGAPIMHLPLPDSSRAAPFSLEEVPADLIACTLAAEDKRFYEHGGIDPLATLRAARDFLAHRRVVSGASTITQQLIKIASPPSKRSPLTKIREALTARRLEMTWTKKQILTAYLNRIDYGNLRTGTAEAARFYFQKPLTDLSLAECALLAGLPQAPSRLNPIRHSERATERRNTVLTRLANTSYDKRRISTALSEKLTLRPLQESQSAPWLATQAQFPNAGSAIQTTLDLPLQNDLEAIVREETEKLKSANLRHAAVVVIHNPTGEILALVSSSDWNDRRGGQLNGALMPRSPGSTLKPFTYLLAIERNQRVPSSILADIPTPFRTPQGLDLPENYDRTYRGPVMLRTALACSLNVPALRELNALGGPQPLFDLLTRLGIRTLGHDPSVHGLGLTLGNAPVTLLELTNAYATLARSGQYFPPVLFSSKHEPAQQLFDARAAYLITDILSDQTARAPSFQPGGPLDFPFPCAVKTGTSSDFHDNWCLGFTPEFTVGVWAGNFEQQPMKGLSGIAGAGPIFHRAMVRLYQTNQPSWFKRLDGLVDIVIDARNGKLIPDSEGNPYLRHDLAPPDKLPSGTTSSDYDDSGKALLDPIYAEWFSSRHNLRRNDLALNAQPALEPLRVISPADNAVFLLDPEIPSGSDKLRPVTNLPGTALWKSDTLRIEPGTPEPIIHLTPGIHTLTATDPRTSKSQTFTLRVKSL
ncbi:MAG: penicillin-binding protein 1C [Luteolibacter sp.]